MFCICRHARTGEQDMTDWLSSLAISFVLAPSYPWCWALFLYCWQLLCYLCSTWSMMGHFDFAQNLLVQLQLSPHKNLYCQKEMVAWICVLALFFHFWTSCSEFTHNSYCHRLAHYADTCDFIYIQSSIQKEIDRELHSQLTNVI